MLTPNRFIGIRTLLLLFCCALIVASGCRRRPGPVQTEPVEDPPVVEEVFEAPEPEPEPEPAPVPPPPPVRVTVLVSDELPHYQYVGDELVRQAGSDNVSVYSLAGSEARAAQILDEIGGPENVLAVGLLAAKAAERLPESKVVFCQVFNYHENGLPGEGVCGIEMMPHLAHAVELWTDLDPELKRIGVITGPGQARRLARASAELREHDIDLVYRVTNSDKETLLEFQRLLDEIDGYWMFPDNRVLSSSTIREIMALSKRNRIGVLANDPGFHQIGALICAASEPAEIAAEAWAMFENARDLTRFEASSVEPLSRCSVTIREDVAAHLGYPTDDLPEELLAR